MKKTVFMTGATGVMGRQGLKELLKHPDSYDVVVLARKSAKNERLLKPIADRLRIVWGDLMNYDDVLAGVSGADVVLHLGGLVSPAADYQPEKTLKVNVTAAQNIVDAVLAQPNPEKIKVVYIGSVAQISDRRVPCHWGRVGDPVFPSRFDSYGVSKIIAERIFADSGIPNWVSLRQSGILYPGILKNFDPIMFHVPLKGCLEWATVEDSGRLLERVCRDEVPESFWNHFYNISSGAQYRMTNYDFECRILKAVHCPRPEKIFETNWFVLKNFHGHYYLDADKLDDILHFRENMPLDEYFSRLSASLPSFFRLAKIVPPQIIKAVLRRLANKKDKGTQYWIKNGCTEKIEAFYGGMDMYSAIPGWDSIDLSELPPYDKATHVSHGYDEQKALSQLSIDDLRAAAAFRGGHLVSEDYSGNPEEKLSWQCHKGHQFTASVKLILEGGHWCPECLSPDADIAEQARHSPFLAQIYSGKI
ncbi:MAG: NAD(P)-dependent oxidoreductase [Bacteroidales bacterium]|nr:NAD(P)-dependent oxidoreductase [Bacteroidales bacterium]